MSTTRQDLETHLLSIIIDEKPLTMGQVSSSLALRVGEGVHHRAVDRALQVLRKRKVIAYQKSTGDKGTHGWVRLAPR